MTSEEIRKDPLKFYGTTVWQNTREIVKTLDHNECQICKAHGDYSPAELAHHIYHVRAYPRYATSIWVTDKDGKRKRNIISVCKKCHETVCHPERLHKKYKKPITRERW